MPGSGATASSAAPFRLHVHEKMESVGVACRQLQKIIQPPQLLKHTSRFVPSVRVQSKAFAFDACENSAHGRESVFRSMPLDLWQRHGFELLVLQDLQRHCSSVDEA